MTLLGVLPLLASRGESCKRGNSSLFSAVLFCLFIVSVFTVSASPNAAEIILKPTVQTASGETVIVLGNQPALSNWDKAGGLPCTKSATTTVWTCQAFTLANGVAYQYKYVKRNASGVLTYESGSNRSRVAPAVATQYTEAWGVSGGTASVVVLSSSSQSSSVVLSSSSQSSSKSSSSAASSSKSSSNTSSSVSSNTAISSSVKSSSKSSSATSSSSSISSAAVQIILKPTVATATGEAVIVLGDKAELSSWNKAAGLPCTKAATTSVWTCQAFTLAAGTAYNYKYAKRTSAGVVSYESGSNRSRVAPTVTTQYSENWGVAGGVAAEVVASSSSRSSIASSISSMSSSKSSSLSSSSSSKSSSSSSSSAPLVTPLVPNSIAPSLNGNSVNLTWPASSGATYYEIRKVTGTIEENVSVTNLSNSAGMVTATEQNILTGKSYLYRIRACVSSGAQTACSAWRDAANFLVVAPKAPSIMTASLNGNSVNLSWIASDANTTYEVQKNASFFAATGANILASSDVNVGTGSFIYRVRACIGGSCSNWTDSNAINIAPSTPSTIDLKINDGTVIVSWSASLGAANYQLYRDGELLASVGVNTFTDTFKEKPAILILHGDVSTPIQYGIAVPAGIKYGQSYNYSVVACGTGGCSGSRSALIVPPPLTVSGLTLTNLNTWYMNGIFANIAWAPALGATRYELWRNDVLIYVGAELNFNTLWPNISLDNYSIKACVGFVCSAATSTKPSITEISDQEINSGSSTGAISFVIADADTNLSSLAVTAVSSNQALIPQTSISFSGSGASRSITVNPVSNASGASNISVTVSDGVKSSTETFGVTVKKESLSPQEITNSNYDIYIGDLNSDGKSDYYFHGRQQFIIIHADIAVPIVITPPSFVIFGSDSEPRYSKPELLRLSSEQLAAKVANNNLRLAQLNVDYFIWTDGISGQSSVLLRGADSTVPSLQLSSSAAQQLPAISQIFHIYNRSANLSDRSFSISIADTNADGRKDISINGAKYQSQSSGIISPTVTGAAIATSITKTTELTNGVVNTSVPMEAPSGDLVGTLSGEFRVNESGAATYSVAITAADGIAGVTPRISIGYSSQGGNGLLGKGWSLGGLSEITRCRQTLSQDGNAKPITWTDSDRFCLDGQRLMLVAGTTNKYKTEIDTYVTVTLSGSNANPDFFTVEAKDGSTSVYGGEALAKVDTVNGTLTWSISSFKDNVGNAINYVYEKKLSSHHVIKQINYAYNSAAISNAKIIFEYETRDDQSRGFIAGIEMFSTQRLKSITSYNGSLVVRAYNIKYDYAPARAGGYSRVRSVQECAEANTVSTTKCYKPTEFTWFTPASPNTFSKDLGGTDIQSGQSTVTNQAYLDINGNGMLDYIWSYVVGDMTFISYSLDSATGMKTTVSSSFPAMNTKQAPKFEPIDYNGDGKQDLLMYNPADKKWSLYLSVRTASGWQLQFKNVFLPFASSEDIKVGDINSDGLADVVIKNSDWYGFTVFKLIKSNTTSDSNQFFKFDEGTSFSASSVANSLLAQLGNPGL